MDEDWSSHMWQAHFHTDVIVGKEKADSIYLVKN